MAEVSATLEATSDAADTVASGSRHARGRSGVRVHLVRRRIELDPAAPRFLLAEPGVAYGMPAQAALIAAQASSV